MAFVRIKSEEVSPDFFLFPPQLRVNNLAIVPKKPFVLMTLVNSDHYDICIDGELQMCFKHRVDFHNVSRIEVAGGCGLTISKLEERDHPRLCVLHVLIVLKMKYFVFIQIKIGFFGISTLFIEHFSRLLGRAMKHFTEQFNDVETVDQQLTSLQTKGGGIEVFHNPATPFIRQLQNLKPGVRITISAKPATTAVQFYVNICEQISGGQFIAFNL